MPKNEHFRITSKTKSGRPISPPWQATSAVSRLSRQKIAPNQKTRSDRDWRSSITPTHATMAAIVAPVAILAPRVTAPKARAARTLRASTFNGVKVAQPKVRAGRRTLCRGKTPLHGACDIFHLLVSHRRARRGPRSRPRDEIKPVARAGGTRGIPSWRFRSGDPVSRLEGPTTGLDPDRSRSGVAALSPDVSPVAFVETQTSCFFVFCRTRTGEFVKSRRRLTLTDCHD